MSKIIEIFQIEHSIFSIRFYNNRFYLYQKIGKNNWNNVKSSKEYDSKLFEGIGKLII